MNRGKRIEEKVRERFLCKVAWRSAAFQCSEHLVLYLGSVISRVRVNRWLRVKME